MKRYTVLYSTVIYTYCSEAWNKFNSQSKISFSNSSQFDFDIGKISKISH